MNKEQGQHLKIGDRVVHRVSGNTGEIREIIPDWGVEVWNYDRNRERERWWWDSMTVRNPRSIKRYPRPFRFARLKPSKQCHCPEGVILIRRARGNKVISKKAVNRRMKVVCENTVRCEFCKNLIGKESYPQRFRRAESMLRKAGASGTLPKRKASKAVARTKRKVSHPSSPPRKKTKNSPSRVGVRPKRSKAKGRSNEKSTSTETPVTAVPTDPEISTPQTTTEIPPPQNEKVLELTEDNMPEVEAPTGEGEEHKG